MNIIHSGLHNLLSLPVVKGIETHWELIAVFAYFGLVFLILKTFQYNREGNEK